MDEIERILGINSKKLSKCCGVTYRKVDGVDYCSNCNLER